MADEDTEITIPARPARALIDVVKNAAKACKRINESKNGEIRAAGQRHGVSREMVGLMTKLDLKSAEDLADWRDEFDHWWRVLALDKRAESAPRFTALTHRNAEDDADESAAA
jgi:hypothetical protein